MHGLFRMLGGLTGSSSILGRLRSVKAEVLEFGVACLQRAAGLFRTERILHNNSPACHQPRARIRGDG